MRDLRGLANALTQLVALTQQRAAVGIRRAQIGDQSYKAREPERGGW